MPGVISKLKKKKYMKDGMYLDISVFAIAQLELDVLKSVLLKNLYCSKM